MNYKVGECDGYFTASNGTVTSPSYPNQYPSNADCIYTISQPTGTIIVLSFHSIDIEKNPTCNYDYLEIRDGLSSGSPVLGKKLCSNVIPAPIRSNKNQLWMKLEQNISKID